MAIIKLMFLLVLVVSLIEGRDLKDEKPPYNPQPQTLFYQYFTPMKLAKVASFIHYHNNLTPRLLTFLSAPKASYRLMLVPLIPPAAVTTTNANLVIKMTVGMEKKFSVPDHDPSFVISDGKHFIGAMIKDKSDYSASAPCVGIEGASGPRMNQGRTDAWLPKASESYYPGRFEIQLSLSERWGTCFVALDGGFSREMIYQNKLDPRNGLFLEIYANDAQEKEGIKYIEMTILKEN